MISLYILQIAFSIIAIVFWGAGALIYRRGDDFALSRRYMAYGFISYAASLVFMTFIIIGG